MTGRRFRGRAAAGLALLCLACILPGEPTDAERVVFKLQFTQPLRVTLGNPDSMTTQVARPPISVTASGVRLSDAEYRLESGNPSIAVVSPDGQGLIGRARGMAKIRVVLPTALGAPDTTFDAQVVIAGILINPSPLTLMRLADTARLAAIAVDAGQRAVSGVPFSWASSKPGVATITSDGLVTAVSEGTTVITATADDVVGPANLTVVQAAARVQVSPKIDTLRTVGRVRTFQAFAYDSANLPMHPIKIRWRSTNPTVATIDSDGVAVTLGPGTAGIVAQVGPAADTAALVLKQTIASVNVTPKLDTLTAIDDTSTFAALGSDSASYLIPAIPPVTWASADTTIATVDPTGRVRARGNGLVLITASSGGLSGTGVVLVRQQVAKAQIVEDSVALAGEGATARLTAVGVDRNGYPVPPGTRFQWTSRMRLVATVDTGGLVTALGDGRTKVTAAPLTGGMFDTATVIVTGAPQRLIAFDSPAGVELMHTDGSTRSVIVSSYSDYYYGTYVPGDPVWSPDGSRLAYAAQTNDYYYGSSWSLQVAYPDGTNLAQPFDDASGPVGDPTWSPDGKRIAFTWVPGGHSDIYVVSATGSVATRLTNDAVGPDSKPAWSPDGTKIAFQSGRDGNLEIYVMNADGSALTRLTNNPGPDAQPAWSPDGSQLAFASNRAGVQDIWLMNADGSGLTNLTHESSGTGDASPAWSPDGSQLVFASIACAGCTSDLYIINRDGTGLQRLTTNAGASNPSWRVTAPIVPPPTAPAGTARRRAPSRR
jgi:uncharacterized protein YjdB